MGRIFIGLTAALLAACGVGCTERTAACAQNPPLDALAESRRVAVQKALAAHADGLCRSDECEFRVRALADDRTLVRVRAVRYSAPRKECVTVFMGQAGEVFDREGRHVDRWPYCLTMAREVEHDPSFRPDPSFSSCGEPSA